MPRKYICVCPGPQAYRKHLKAQDDELRLLRAENERKKSLCNMYESVLRKHLAQLPDGGDADIVTLFDTAGNANRRADRGVIDEMHKAMEQQKVSGCLGGWCAAPDE